VAQLVLHAPEHHFVAAKHRLEADNEFSVLLVGAKQPIAIGCVVITAEPEQVLGMIIVTFRDRIEVRRLTSVLVRIAYGAFGVGLALYLLPDSCRNMRALSIFP
jgi:hypothetical protein